MPIISAFGRLRQEDCLEFRATEPDPISNNIHTHTTSFQSLSISLLTCPQFQTLMSIFFSPKTQTKIAAVAINVTVLPSLLPSYTVTAEKLANPLIKDLYFPL